MAVDSSTEASLRRAADLGPSRAAERSHPRSYALSLSPRAAVDRLRTRDGLPIYDAERAKRRPGDHPFAILTDDGFTIYRPWEVQYPHTLAIGPAVRGRVVPTSAGSRIDVRVRPYAPVEWQKPRLRMMALVFAALAALFATTGVAAFVAVLAMASACILSLLFYGRQKRARDIADLLSIVEGTYGPVALPTRDDTPHRRGD